MMTTQEQFRSFVLSILDDDEGISEEAWDKLTDYLQSVGEMELVGELCALVKSSNGRRYIL
jgi:hypothetical protein